MTRLVHRKCRICPNTFTDSPWHKFCDSCARVRRNDKQKVYEKSHRQQRNEYWKKYAQGNQKLREYKTAWERWSRGAGPHPGTGEWKKISKFNHPVEVLGPDKTCYWCLYSFPSVLNACPRCQTAYDPQNAAKAKSRARKGYLDIVADNAKREGRDPEAEKRKVKQARAIVSWEPEEQGQEQGQEEEPPNL